MSLKKAPWGRFGRHPQRGCLASLTHIALGGGGGTWALFEASSTLLRWVHFNRPSLTWNCIPALLPTVRLQAVHLISPPFVFSSVMGEAVSSGMGGVSPVPGFGDASSLAVEGMCQQEKAFAIKYSLSQAFMNSAGRFSTYLFCRLP